MIPTMTELADTELDAVSGGLLNNLNITTPQINVTSPSPQINVMPQMNFGVQTGVAAAVLGAAAAVQQALGQGNGA
jgi:hypothetical protein